MTLKLEIVLEELRILRARSAELEELYEKSRLKESTRNIQKIFSKQIFDISNYPKFVY